MTKIMIFLWNILLLINWTFARFLETITYFFLKVVLTFLLLLLEHEFAERRLINIEKIVLTSRYSTLIKRRVPTGTWDIINL